MACDVDFLPNKPLVKAQATLLLLALGLHRLFPKLLRMFLRGFNSW
jgi:hypothetical protein